MLRLLGFLVGSAVALSLVLVVSGRIEPSELDEAADEVQRVAMNAVAAANNLGEDLREEVSAVAAAAEPEAVTSGAEPETVDPEAANHEAIDTMSFSEPFAMLLSEPETDPASRPEPGTLPEPEPEPEAQDFIEPEPATVPDPFADPDPQAAAQTVERGLDESLFDHRVSPLVKDPETELPLDKQMQADGLLWHVFWDPFRSEIAATGFIEQLETVTALNYGVIRRKIGVYEVAFAYSDEDERDAGLLAIEQATGISFAEWQQ